MPTQLDMENAQRFYNEGICSCGNPHGDHAESVAELKDAPIRCALIKSEVMPWHTPRQQG